MPPSRVRGAVEESLRSLAQPPYGFILAAAADFSSAARETFRELMRNRGIQEFAVWGKAELEDKLFEPRHDHLLFAYFGISIQAGRRSARTVLTGRMAMKRRLVKLLGDVSEFSHKDVLLRDAEASDYPHPRDPEAFRHNPRWRYYRCYGHLRVDQLAFVVREYWAWIKEDAKCWDAIETYDQAYVYDPELFGGPGRPEETNEEEEYARRFWLIHVPEGEQVTLRKLGFIHYDRIAVVDELGDQCHEPPHLLVTCNRSDELFHDTIDVLEQGYGYNHKLWLMNELKRDALFPSPMPPMTSEEFSAALERKHGEQRRGSA